jgi:hypothetical protein
MRSSTDPEGTLCGSVQLAGIVGAVEQVLGHHAFLGHLRGLSVTLGHVAVLAVHTLREVGAFLPLEVGGLDPDAVGAHLVVAGPAEVACLYELVFHGVVVG